MTPTRLFAVACTLMTAAAGCAVAPADEPDDTSSMEEEITVSPRSLAGSYEATTASPFGFDKLELRANGTYSAIETRFCIRPPCPPGVETGRFVTYSTPGNAPAYLRLIPREGAVRDFRLRVTATGIVLSQLGRTVRFDRVVSTAPCVITGCSRHVCADREVITTCEYRPVYACYANATCERDATGACGWRQTPELRACIAANGGI